MVTSPELCCNIGRKEVRVAASHVDICVLYMQQAVEHIHKLINLLHLIQNNEMQLLAGYPVAHVPILHRKDTNNF